MLKNLIIGVAIIIASISKCFGISIVELRERSVPILIERSDKISRLGSGFLMDNNTVLTAKHVAEKLDNFKGQYIIYKNEIYDVKVSYMSKNSDTAILTLKNVKLDLKPIVISSSQRQSVGISYGYPENILSRIDTEMIRLPAQEGGMKNFNGKPTEIPLLYMTGFKIIGYHSKETIGGIRSDKLIRCIMPLKGPGMSGGAMFNSNMELIGVFMAEETKIEAVGYGVPIEFVEQELFEKARRD